MSLRRDAARIDATLVIPAYNAQGLIATTLRDVRDWLGGRPEAWEVVVVDDASSDGTLAVVEAFAAAHPDEAWRVIRFTQNRGKGFAVRAGLDAARGEVSVFTDCDLAYPMANVATILRALADGADAAIACRVHPDTTYLIKPDFFSYLFTRHIMGRCFSTICRIVTLPGLSDTQAGLKGFRTAVVRPILGRLRLDGFSFDVELLRALVDGGAKIAEVPVAYRYDSEPTTVRFTMDALSMARDLLRIRYRSLRKRYAPRRESPKRLVIHADDFGLAAGVNRAIQEGLLAGEITSASILVGGRQSAEALAWAASHREFDFGVHLNITQGRPVLPPDHVPSLVDREGRFRPLGALLFRLATGRVRRAEIEAEWRAQIAAVRSAGVAISHLDSHQHVHLLPPIFRRVAVGLAESEGLVLRAMNGPVVVRSMHPDIKGLALAIATRIDLGRRHRGLPGARGAGTALMEHGSFDALRATLQNAEPGETYELVVHPGVVDDDLRSSGDRYHAGRERERELLAADETRAWLRFAGFELCDFKRRAS
ncbi:MAG TPA: ChbG/HpnK family deacetylase [Candidatus Polarisedimenticolaceae bacterium]|nr:ChbG/HpnK family deacetylase [Candidatus Polarisedimenticolaceae bacterium]